MLERYGGFEAGQRGPEAVVCAVAEAQWRGTGPVCVELVGLVVDGRITVGSSEYDEGRFAGADAYVAEDVVLCGGTRHDLRGAIEAQQFRDQSSVAGVNGLDRPGAASLWC